MRHPLLLPSGVKRKLTAMTTDRPYRMALPVGTAVAELRGQAGRQFDPAVVERADHRGSRAGARRSGLTVRLADA